MTMSFVSPLARAERAWRHVFIRDFELDALIGIHPIEKEQAQRIRINLDLAVSEPVSDLHDDLANVVCYEQMANNIRAIVATGHINLVETLAERVAAMSLEDRRVRRVRVRIEKLNAISGASGAGVEIERHTS
jgi:dihydroneopterin aldolase